MHYIWKATSEDGSVGRGAETCNVDSQVQGLINIDYWNRLGKIPRNTFPIWEYKFVRFVHEYNRP